MKLSDIARFIDGELSSGADAGVVVKGINGIKEAREGDLTFIMSPELEAFVDMSRASCVLIPRSIKKEFRKSVIRVDNPSIAFSKIIAKLCPEKFSHPTGINSSAVIAKTAQIASGVSIGAYAVIEDGVVIGESTIIYPFCYIGKGTKIGAHSVIYPNVTVRETITIGNRVIIHSGSVIGSDGFGYDTDKAGVHIKIPQLGNVIIEDDVEIGACTTIDRARFASTVIARGTKIDNLVQIAHNVKIGPNCIIAAQVGVAGSCELGRNVVLGGQVGVADHSKLGDFMKAGAKTGLTTKDYPANSAYFWYPAKPMRKAQELLGSIGLLPKLFERVRKLEEKIKTLEAKDTDTHG